MAVSMQNGGARRLLDFNTNLDVTLLEQVDFLACAHQVFYLIWLYIVIFEDFFRLRS
jgi:hypothetical protein